MVGWDEIGRRIKRQREDLRLTQQAAAQEAGIGSGTWYAIENARREVYDSTTTRGVCRALSWPPNQIAVWRDEETELEPVVEDALPTDRDLTMLLIERVEHLSAEVSEMRRVIEGRGIQGADTEPPEPSL